MIQQSIQRLQYLCDTIPELLAEIDEHEFSKKSDPATWSKKEILGHLIDSATNNHHRFVRGQFEDTPAIVYNQNEWNNNGHYQAIDNRQIIEFWAIYNRQILALIKHIPKDKLNNPVKTEGVYTIGFLVNDYVVHLEHHLRQIVAY